ncbi:MAG: S41 family peptidase [Sphingomonadaceae bacterium]
MVIASPATAADANDPAVSAVKDPMAARVADLDWLIDQIGTHYVYLPHSGLDLDRLRALYRPEAASATTHAAWLHVLESLIGELHDDHATLRANTPSSPQLIPTGTDLWAEFDHGKAIVTQVRAESPASHAGIEPGDRIVAIDDVPVQRAVEVALPHALSLTQASDFTLRRLLAGTHDRVRIVTLVDHRRIVLPPYQPPSSTQPLSWKWLEPGIGYIRFNNSLGETDTVAAFDKALARLRNAHGVILDLRDTPSGGNTDVAEPILGRLIAHTGHYQRIGAPDMRSYGTKGSVLRPIAPRGPFTLSAPLVVLVDRWTGSMGEGMTVGLKALDRAKVVGARMAGLRGGTQDFTLPHTGITVDFPTYRIMQVDGTPREDFLPDIQVDLYHGNHSTDPILTAGTKALKELMARSAR